MTWVVSSVHCVWIFSKKLRFTKCLFVQVYLLLILIIVIFVIKKYVILGDLLSQISDDKISDGTFDMDVDDETLVVSTARNATKELLFYTIQD